ncbi:MAG: hypothetical protein Q3998_06380 [Porphyromonas sp.]|nr:hypothetical protein [Porphyromonas sp.]
MKQISSILLFVLTAILLQSCDPFFWKNGRDEKQVHIPHYVMGYLDNAKELSIDHYGYEGSIDISWAHSVLVLGWDSKGEDLEKYKALCTKNGDTKYEALSSVVGKDGGFNYLNHGRYYYNSNAITGINVTSDAAWDETHPAGTSLNDIIIFHSNALDPFIKAGYKGFFAWNEKAQKFVPTTPENSHSNKLGKIECRLSKFDFSSCRLLGMGEVKLASLKIGKKPTQEKKHIIKIEVLFEDGTKTSKLISVNYPENN